MGFPQFGVAAQSFLSCRPWPRVRDAVTIEPQILRWVLLGSWDPPSKSVILLIWQQCKDLSDRNYKPRRAAQNKPDPSLSGKVGGSGEDRSTTTYRLAVNDQNRARVTAWLGGDEIGRDPVQISELLLKSARIDPLDINKNDDFAKFLHDSQDAQIDTQTTTEVSGSTDNSLNLKIASGGIKDDLKSSSSTGQIYFPLENGQRVARKAVGCK